jgi:hypothetical protein
MQASFLRPAKTGLKIFWRKSTPLTLSTVLLGISPVFASLKNVKVISSSNEEFRFVVKFENSGSLNRSVETDSVLQLAHTVQVCVPFGASARLVSANGIGSQAIGKSSTTQRLVSMPLVQLSDKWTMRGREFVTVIISPVFGNNLYEQVEVDLVFEGAIDQNGSASFDPKFNKILSASIANWDECKNWSTQPRAARKSIAQPGPFAISADWFKVAVYQTGLHTISFDDLSNAGLVQSSVASNDIFVYNGGGEQLNSRLTDPRPVFSQIAITVEDGGDGQFQPGDRILFYGEALGRWEYDSAGASYIRNHYTVENVFWVAVSANISDVPLRINTVDATPTGTAIDTMNSYTHYVRSEQENLLRQFNDGQIDNYYNWYWANEEQYSIFVPVSNLVPGQTASISISAKTFDTLGAPNLPGSYVDLLVNNLAATSKQCNINGCTFQSTNLVNGLNSFDMELHGISFADPYFDYL